MIYIDITPVNKKWLYLLRETILGKEITIRPVIKLSKFRPKGDLEELRKRLEAQNEDIAQIELELIV